MAVSCMRSEISSGQDESEDRKLVMQIQRRYGKYVYLVVNRSINQ